MAELVARLRRFEELIIPDATAALLISMSAATMDRRLGPDRTGPTTPSMPGFLRREWFSGSGDMRLFAVEGVARVGGSVAA